MQSTRLYLSLSLSFSFSRESYYYFVYFGVWCFFCVAVARSLRKIIITNLKNTLLQNVIVFYTITTQNLIHFSLLVEKKKTSDRPIWLANWIRSPSFSFSFSLYFENWYWFDSHIKLWPFSQYTVFKQTLVVFYWITQYWRRAIIVYYLSICRIYEI